jgi:hypothetical protein
VVGVPVERRIPPDRRRPPACATMLPMAATPHTLAPAALAERERVLRILRALASEIRAQGEHVERMQVGHGQRARRSRIVLRCHDRCAGER